MSENKSDGSRPTWEDIGKGAAAQIKKTARKVPHIEARGYLCHELTYLLGGCVSFTETPMSKLITKAMEYFLPISPICRWMPPSNSTLEKVGYVGTGETTVYRYKPESGDAVVFFVNFKPEPPAWGPYLRPLFNMPQLDLYQFLRPPFAEADRHEMDHVFRRGMVGRFAPIPMTEGAKESMEITGVEIRRAMWEEFCRS